MSETTVKEKEQLLDKPWVSWALLVTGVVVVVAFIGLITATVIHDHEREFSSTFVTEGCVITGKNTVNNVRLPNKYYVSTSCGKYQAQKSADYRALKIGETYTLTATTNRKYITDAQ
jgi:hypothetical protein